jgi:hypothetical protein
MQSTSVQLHNQPSEKKGPVFSLPKYRNLELFFLAQQPLLGQYLLSIQTSRSYSYSPHSVELLCTSDHPDAVTSTWQHTTLTTDILTPDGIRTRNPNKRAAADLRPRLLGHRDRHRYWNYPNIFLYTFSSNAHNLCICVTVRDRVYVFRFKTAF